MITNYKLVIAAFEITLSRTILARIKGEEDFDKSLGRILTIP